jgi:hypothetical protein
MGVSPYKIYNSNKRISRPNEVSKIAERVLGEYPIYSAECIFLLLQCERVPLLLT